MCGIHGILSLRGDETLDRALADRMGDISRHRGPDDSGLFERPGLLLGMRRLSIIDIAGGHQPLHTADGKVQLVCNGEIYNFRELRRELQAQGRRFATGSDCEVLVQLYAEQGDAMVGRLDGMFGFALWDEYKHRLLIGRDRLGIKPVYYSIDGGRLIFASEIKSILAVARMPREIDRDALDELLYLGYVTAPRTLFQGIKKLPPGHLLVAEDGQISVKSYWSPVTADPFGSEEEAREELLAAVRRSVRQQMVADVPLGAFLSGGIDSSAVVAMMAGAGSGPTKTYSIGFDLGRAGTYYNELPDARRVAQHFATEHREIIVRPDVVELLPRLLWHMDEPIADSAIMTTFLVAEFARRDVTVILSGVGGDELLGGYRRYLGPHYLSRFEYVPRWVRERWLVPLAARLPSDRHDPVSNLLRYAREFVSHSTLPVEEQYIAYVRLFDSAARMRLVRGGIPPAGRDPLADAFRRFPGTDFVNRLMQVDMVTQLPDDLLLLTDKTTMATSLECRVPLLSNTMVDLAARVPSSMKIHGAGLKHLFKTALRDSLPPQVLKKAKRGFGAPMGVWLKQELRPLMHATLSPESMDRRGLFDPAVVAETMAMHESARHDFSDNLQCLMNLEIWCRIFLDRRSPEDVAAEIAEKTQVARVA
ncbi:MAG: asparagine synthase (glutamine-hydrolyzing) [Gammaproteobacteria bacterium]|nr:asparagine synthase (glutamine-hydrolyzing) [Gammaproteobacteria bacterium]